MNPILEAILKASQASAAQQQSQRAPSQAQDPLSGMLEGILGGGNQRQPQRAPSQAQDPISGLLEGILGGGGMPQAAPAAPQGAGGLDIGDLIGSLIGANASQGQPHQNGIADMIGAIMGGGAGGGSRSAANPIANMLAQKLGIPPALAQAAVAFFMAKMFERKMQPRAPRNDNSGGFQPQRQDTDSLDLDDLLDSMGDSGSLGTRFSNSGMDSELAEKTGMQPQQANQALQEIVKIFGELRGKPNPVTTKGVDLKGLLDAWD
ncbi:MAG TPA: hypothetical protein ENJ56_01745 [Anaerolineae bacterium]|nr:hypothetical protein [Anaerolineae bacterium]